MRGVTETSVSPARSRSGTCAVVRDLLTHALEAVPSYRTEDRRTQESSRQYQTLSPTESVKRTPKTCKVTEFRTRSNGPAKIITSRSRSAIAALISPSFSLYQALGRPNRDVFPRAFHFSFPRTYRHNRVIRDYIDRRSPDIYFCM